MSSERTGRAAGPRVSLRLRLTLWVVAIYTMIQWATGGVFSMYQALSIRTMFDERLVERAEAIVESVYPVVPSIGRDDLDRIADEDVRRRRMDEIVIEVLKPDGSSAIIGSSWRIDASAIPVATVLESGDPVFLDLRAEGLRTSSGETVRNARAVAMSMLGADLESYVLLVASSDATAQGQLALVRRIFLVSAIVGPLAAAVSGWFVAGIAVAPLNRLRRLATRFGPDSLDQTFEMPTANKEVAALTAQLEEARVRIREAFAAQERFLTNVSHELKTPIAVLMIEAETLRLDHASEEVVAFVTSAREEMSKLGRLMESFLTLARLNEGRAGRRGKRYVVNDLVMDAVDDCAAMAAQQGVRLSTELLSDEEGLSAEISGDEQLLRTMIDNLVRTALRFTPRGKRVMVAIEIVDERVRITVTDEGASIPCEEIDVIFDRFTGSVGQMNNGRGYGLGLAIAQGIAELHGGRIRAVNRDEGGCEFAVELPLASSDGA